MKKLVLMDWASNEVETPIDLDDLSEIKQIEIRVISGDEVAIVHWKDGKTSAYDSSNCRMIDFFDYKYILWCKGKFAIDKEIFLKRKNTYSVGGYMMEMKGDNND